MARAARECGVRLLPHSDQHQHALRLQHQNTKLNEPGKIPVFQVISQVPKLDGLERPDRVVQVTPDMAGRSTLPRLLTKPLEQVAHIELRHSGGEEPDVLSTNRPHVEQASPGDDRRETRQTGEESDWCRPSHPEGLGEKDSVGAQRTSARVISLYRLRRRTRRSAPGSTRRKPPVDPACPPRRASSCRHGRARSPP